MKRSIILGTIIAVLLAAFPLAKLVFPATTQTTAITFNPDQHLVNPARPSVFGTQELEPGIKTDSHGDTYINAIRGVPAGTDIWKTTTSGCQASTTQTCPIFYEGQPEGIATTGSGTGGGDIDMDVGHPYNAGDCLDPGTPSSGAGCSGSTNGNLYMASLTLANQTVITCKDSNLAISSCLPQNPVGTSQTDEDREWVAAEGKHTAYLSYHVVGPQSISVCKSVNDGQSFPTCSKADTGTPQAAQSNQLGNIVVDQTHATHYLYQVYTGVRDLTQKAALCKQDTVYVAVSDSSAGAGTLGLTFTDHMAYTEPVAAGATCPTKSINHIFPSIATDSAGYVYVTWTDGSNVFYASSTDHGVTWNGATDGTGIPTQVSLPYGPSETDCTSAPPTQPGLHTSLFPWIASSPTAAPGHVDFVWYGSPTTVYQSSNSNFGCPSAAGRQGTPWNVYFAETFAGTRYATAANPNGGPDIFQTVANHSPNHYGSICQGGTLCTSGRTLGDFFQVALEQSTDCAVIAYANDTAAAPTPTQAYFNRQLNGCSAAPSAPTAVHLSRITSHRTAGAVHLSWTANSAYASGFNVLAVRANGHLQRLNGHLLLGSGRTSGGMLTFRFNTHAAIGQYYLQAVDRAGHATRYGPYTVGGSYL